MHPNTFLRNFWQPQIRPQIFVAMSFDPRYEPRYRDVIVPAITAITWRGINLQPLRVDVSKTGDSILTEIMDGITHSLMVLADVSTVGKDAATSKPYRNSNVLYEVGVALACRHTTDVLLIRDDEDKFLFDVSTIPHKKMNFTDTGAAAKDLSEELVERLKAQRFQHDARVQIALRTLVDNDADILKELYKHSKEGKGAGWAESHVFMQATLRRLADKGLVVTIGKFKAGHFTYSLTPIGIEVAEGLEKGLTVYDALPHPADSTATDPPGNPAIGEEPPK